MRGTEDFKTGLGIAKRVKKRRKEIGWGKKGREK